MPEPGTQQMELFQDPPDLHAGLHATRLPPNIMGRRLWEVADGYCLMGWHFTKAAAVAQIETIRARRRKEACPPH